LNLFTFTQARFSYLIQNLHSAPYSTYSLNQEPFYLEILSHSMARFQTLIVLHRKFYNLYLPCTPNPELVIAKLRKTELINLEPPLFCICASLHTRDWLITRCFACAPRCTLVIG